MADAERGKGEHGHRHVSELAVALIIFFGALIYFNATLHLTLELRDEGYLFYSIARVAHGEIPHRDFPEVYGPGFYALTAPIFQVFGDRIFPIRELMAVVRAAAVAFAYLIARHLVPRPFALLAALLATVYWGRVIWNLNAPYAALFTISLCMLSLVLLLKGQKQDRRSSYLWAGLVCGGAFLFKWSLAAVSAYGMALAICATAMLRDPPPEGPRTRVHLALLVWVSLGALIVVPFLSTLTPFDYLLHFAPMHAFVAFVGVGFARRGDGRSAFAHAFPLLVRYGLGFLVLPVCVCTLYLWWGSLDDLFHNMVYRPFHLRNYGLAVAPPGAASLAYLACLVFWITAGLFLLRGSRRAAGLFALLGCMLAPAAYPALASNWNPSLALHSLMPIQLAVVSLVALSLFASLLARARRTGSDRCSNTLIAVLFFQQMMTFQIFPRATYNVTLMLGTLTPAIAWISYRMYVFATAGGEQEAFARRATAFALSALLPLLLVGEVARTTITSAMAPERGALHSPVLAGIRPRLTPLAPTVVAEFDQLTEYIDTLQPLDAPVFAVPNAIMIYFASGRDHLFEDRALALFLAGWNMLPEDDRETPSPAFMIRRLEQTPEAIVITRSGDPTQAHFMAAFPSVGRHIKRHYYVEKKIGAYQVLRLRRVPRKPARRLSMIPCVSFDLAAFQAPISVEKRSRDTCPGGAELSARETSSGTGLRDRTRNA